MSHLIPVPDRGSAEEKALVDNSIWATVEEKFAEDVIHGRVIHNLDTDEFCLTEHADGEFKAASIVAYRRFLAARR